MSEGSTVHAVPIYAVVDTALEYARLARRWWWALVLAALAAGAIGYYVAANTPDTYRAKLTFLVNEEDGGLGAVTGLLGTFGLGGAGKAYNLNKIVALSKSDKLLRRVLLDTVALDGRDDLLANHIIEVQGLAEEWGLSPGAAIDGPTLEEMSDTARLLLRSVSTYTTESGVLEVGTDDETGILTIESTFRSEALSLYVTQRLYGVLASFYTAQSVSGRKATVDKLSAKADSLEAVLQSAEAQLARRTDTRLGIIGQEPRLRETRLQREIPIIAAAYGQVLTNLETSSFALSTVTPFFSTVDVPYTPLPVVKTKPILAAFGGAFAGLAIAFLVLAAAHFLAHVREPGPLDGTPNQRP